MAYKDKADQAASARRHYEANKEVMKQRAVEAKAKQKSLLLELTRRVKDTPCKDCGIKYPPYVMDFDHVRGTKRKNVSSMVNSGVAVSTIEEEMAKCEVVCSNCHRERTFKRKFIAD